MSVIDARCRGSASAANRSLAVTGATAMLIAAMLCACSGEANPVVAESPAPTTQVSTPAAVESAAEAEAPEIDVASGLVIDEHWELVKAHCSACHSPQLVTQNRGSRQTWLEMIRWMQETQGLWQFDEATQDAILDYLEKNYAPSASHRRAPLAKALMPPNPYSGDGG